ncbi:hypothetical protein HT031_004324 [Scenedesmus sp. PABB004]|nr:hypothetical protein HT031_004324 [Scenedesmus sp. PABB004]
MASGRSRLSCCFAAPRVEEEPAAAVAPAPAGEHKQLTCKTSVVTAHAKALSAADATADFGMGDGKAGSPRVAGRKSEQQPLAQQPSLGLQDMPSIKPLTAMTLNRTYTDDDWFAAMAALDRVKKIQQARALAALRAAHPHRGPGAAGGGAGGPAGGGDDDTEAWYDARSHTMSDSSVAFISDAEREEVARLAHELEAQEHAQQQLTVSLSVKRELAAPTPACVPDPPLLFAEKHWRYCEVDLKPFCFYWERDPVRSSPFPLPIDLQMNLNSLFQKTHQSIPGMWLRDVGNQLLLHAQPTIMAIPGIVNYTEYYNKDQSPESWTLRRDIKVGKTTGQMFMTTDGLLIFRVFTSGVFSKAIEWIGEDYIRLEDGGETIVTRQLCKLFSDNSTCSQFLIGRKIGDAPPGRKAH